MKIRSLVAVSIAASIYLLAGCSSTTYYRVTDPQSGKAYYTTKIKKLRSGSAEFVDAKSGQSVTLQSSEVQKISKEQYKEETNK